jgi:cell pole-organizing protein PopZ
MTFSKLVRTAIVAGTGAALVLGTGVTASAHSTAPAASTLATSPSTARFDDFLSILATLPEFQGMTLAEIKAQILAAIQAAQAAEAAEKAAEQAAEAADKAAEKAAEVKDVNEEDGDNNDEDDGDVEDQQDPVKTKPVAATVKATKPSSGSHEHEHEHEGGHSGHDR